MPRIAKLAPVPLKKRTHKKIGKKDGQYGNVNAQQYGAFTPIDIKKLDGRTKEGKTRKPNSYRLVMPG